MKKMNASQKALIFTESRRTQEYLKRYLEANGYAGKLVLFNGTNSDPMSRRIVQDWIDANQSSGRVTGSRQIDSRTALVENFRDQAQIMIATEAAAEGVNMQFCSLVVNYDLPWNPQRIEQRIGRCHRYGQKHDVVVINFLNDRNHADQRVHELLSLKFSLFEGIFGASDDVLGQIESGVDFERRILAIYQQCRTTTEIDNAFNTLQKEMEESITARMDETRKTLIEHFDQDVHARLKVQMANAQSSLDRIGREFWLLTRVAMHDSATFHDGSLSFELRESPVTEARCGHYQLISKTQDNTPGEFLYRLSHPLGQWAIQHCQSLETPLATVQFDITNYQARMLVVEELKGKSGWLTLQHLRVKTIEEEDYLLFSAFTDNEESLDQETSEKLFQCHAIVSPCHIASTEIDDRLRKEAKQHAKATVATSLESNNELFNEERERLEKWAEDLLIAAENELHDIKAQIKAFRRESRTASTLQQQEEIQKKILDFEKKQRKKVHRQMKCAA